MEWELHSAEKMRGIALVKNLEVGAEKMKSDGNLDKQMENVEPG